MGNKVVQYKWLRVLKLFLLAAVILLGCRLLLNWLTTSAPGYERMANACIGLLFVVLIVVLVMKPIFQIFGIASSKLETRSQKDH